MAVDKAASIPTTIALERKIAELEKKVAEGGDKNKDDRLVAEAMAILESVKVPTQSEMQYRLQRAVEVGELDPIQAQQILADPNMWDKVQAPPETKAAQYKVMERLGQIAEAGGLDAQARARLERIAAEEGMQERGAREAIMQQAAQQGRAGGGLDLAQRLIAQQGSAGRRSMRDTEVAAEAERRALEALMAQGQMAGQIRGQEVGEQERQAAARQAIQQFNVANMLGQQEANIGRRMVAQADKIQEARDVRDMNLQTAQTEQMRKADLPAQQFGMQMQKATPQADIKVKQASDWKATSIADANRASQEAQQAAANKTTKRNTMLSTAGSVIGALAMFSDEKMKEDARPVDKMDVDDFLSNLTGYKYKYKGDDAEKMGVMAQDLEQTPSGAEMVLDTPAGKMVDTAELLNGLLATNINLNERLKELEKKYAK